MLSRRTLLAATAALALPSTGSFAQANKELRIGYQKSGVWVIARQQQLLEKRFAKHGLGVKWIEFTSGPPLLEAINAGAVDIGGVGDSPPIFAQAAGAAIVYVAGVPVNNGQAIVVKPNSRIRDLKDLKGARVAFTKGSECA
ncbi:putative aliphatic sulfonates-binding protein precursor [Variibacter gotjawalensis]|uniref:Putative aliphatic sulfonates-binding protein n=1 Tax=Variibacter gotjawalensis TaxID=1333996 RepID=A0A0S3Q140_9BRAD|nr:ABC-type nitrate/sulfonate/bicarbonate transport system substrate-binding protein [Variibacter gotjawalensis]BAT61911.1 putative aliphatic sulfonates-binding protein precursor [Variibacter gotjawalensis]